MPCNICFAEYSVFQASLTVLPNGRQVLSAKLRELRVQHRELDFGRNCPWDLNLAAETVSIPALRGPTVWTFGVNAKSNSKAELLKLTKSANYPVVGVNSVIRSNVGYGCVRSCDLDDCGFDPFVYPVMTGPSACSNGS